MVISSATMENLPLHGLFDIRVGNMRLKIVVWHCGEAATIKQQGGKGIRRSTMTKCRLDFMRRASVLAHRLIMMRHPAGACVRARGSSCASSAFRKPWMNLGIRRGLSSCLVALMSKVAEVLEYRPLGSWLEGDPYARASSPHPCL